MPTANQRLTAIADATLNRTATDAEKLRLARAHAALFGRQAEFDAATNAEKAQIGVQSIRRALVENVKGFESRQALAVGEQNAAAARDAVDTELAESP